MNKAGQVPYIKEILAIVVLIAVLGALSPLFGSLFNQNCPKCEDCAPYKNQLASCTQELENPKIVYVNKTIEVPIEKIVEKPIYLTNEGISSKIIISTSLILSLSLTLLSFKIKLPKKLEQELYNLEEIIKLVKFGSLILTILIFIKLLIVFNLIGG
jgi:hypothetical protein